MDTKRLLKNKIQLCTAICVIGVFFAGFSSASAATLQINANSAILSPGDTTIVNIVVNTEGVAVNNAEAQILFPSDLIDVLSVSKTGSVLSFWAEDPSFSGGIITFNGGVPTPGYTGAQGLLISVVVKAKKAGQAVFMFSNTAVRANDGLGTNVLTSQQGKIITIVKKEEPLKTIPIVLGPALKIVSSTHPIQDQWYKDRDPVFRWVIPDGSDAIQTIIDNDISVTPRVTYSPAIREKAIKDLEDGVWYFKARARRNKAWGPISAYIVRIDATPPQAKNVAFTYNNNDKILRVAAEIQDIASGIDHYEIFIDDVFVKKISVEEFINGVYMLTFNTPGDHIVKLLASDRANNSVESLGTFRVADVVAPQLIVVPQLESTPLVNDRLSLTAELFIFPMNCFVLIILVIMILLILGAFYSGYERGRLRAGFKMRTALIRGDDSKMLLTLKELLQRHLERLQGIRRERVFTKEEKEFKKAAEDDLDDVDRTIEEHGEGGGFRT